MATNNASNQKFTNNADGFDLAGGTTARKITLSGADVAIVGSGTNVMTMPAATDTLVGRASTDTLTNKTLTSPVINTGVSGTAILDEDNMASDSNTKVPTQQSVKAYIDSGTVTMTNKTLTSPVINTPTLVLANTSPTADGSIGYDRTEEELQIGDGANSLFARMGAWKAFTPSWTGITVGAGGTSVGAYCQIGKTIIFRAKFVFGAGSSISGAATLALPVAKHADQTASHPIGTVVFADSGTTAFQGYIEGDGKIFLYKADGTYTTIGNISSSVPMTWTTSDELDVNGTYEAA